MEPLRWTYKRPEKTGYYWMRDGDLRRHIVHVGEDEDGELIFYFWNGEKHIRYFVSEVGTPWAGPIPEPTEEKK